MWSQKKGNKYHAISCRYGDYIYASKKEAGYAQELDLRIKAKDIKSWDRQIKISLDVGDYHIANYYVDFSITHNDESIELVEIKGMETDVWRIKRKLLEALYLPQHPDTRYTVIK